VTAAAVSAAPGAVSPLALLYHQRRIFKDELIAGQLFAELARGTDHAAYTAACVAACIAGPEAFGVLEDVAIARQPVRSPKGVDHLNEVLHALALHFIATGRMTPSAPAEGATGRLAA
jgi:hypothetical protein